MPVSRGTLDGRILMSENSRRVLPDEGGVVQRVELFCERSNGLLLQNRDESLEPIEFERMKVDEVSAGCDRRIPERLEISPHVFEHGGDQIACGPAVSFDNAHLQNDRIA